MFNKSIKVRKYREKCGVSVIFISSLFSCIAVALITIFLFKEGLVLFKEVSLKEFLTSTEWFPSSDNPKYGILSFIYATFVVTGLSLLFALPFALSLAIFLAKMCPERLRGIIKGCTEVLQGIPSVIFGLVGIAVVVPAVRALFGGNGYSLLSASIVLSIMILPTIVNVSEVSIRAVSRSLCDASTALGATKAQTILRVVLPSSFKGIAVGIILALGRAVGETTAVILVGGNAPILPKSLVSMGRTLTMNIVTDMSYAEGTHMQALFASGVLLFIIILALNMVAIYITHRKGSNKYDR